MASWAEIESALPPAALAALKAAQAKAAKTTSTGPVATPTATATATTATAPALTAPIAIIATTPTPTSSTEDAELLAVQESYQHQSAQQSLLQATPPNELIQTIRHDGVVRINKALPPHLCDQLKSVVDQELATKVEQLNMDGFQAAQAGAPGGFGRVYSRKNRYDLYVKNEGVYAEATKLLLEGSVGDFFRNLFLSDTPNTPNNSAQSDQSDQSDQSATTIHPSMQHLAMSERNASGVVANEPVVASLWEYSTMTSDPNSPRQPIHPDNSWTEQPVLYTAFVALQDITAEMGPTLFLPGTQTQECHDKFLSEKTRCTFLQTEVQYVTSELKKGDVQIMDSRILHAGLANKSADKRRTLFYFTIRNPCCDPRSFVGIPSGK